jgi:ubiquinol-cytochrome c reductase cytochrome c1 subunit
MKTISIILRPLVAIAATTAMIISSVAIAGGGSNVHLDDAHVNLKDQASLQRGARSFVANCLNCHSAQFMRWGHLTQIGLTEDQIKANLMFNPDAKFGDYMTTALDPKDAKAWFGAAPPDLTLVARSRGSDWIYTFLRSYYVDPNSPTGWNNEVFANVGMPHVLHDLQGSAVKAVVGEKESHGKKEAVTKLAIERQGTMTPQEYDAYVRDLVNYMTFMAEPARVKRTQLGVGVMFFLVIAFFAALIVKREYWKDVK